MLLNLINYIPIFAPSRTLLLSTGEGNIWRCVGQTGLSQLGKRWQWHLIGRSQECHPAPDVSDIEGPGPERKCLPPTLLSFAELIPSPETIKLYPISMWLVHSSKQKETISVESMGLSQAAWSQVPTASHPNSLNLVSCFHAFVVWLGHTKALHVWSWQR